MPPNAAQRRRQERQAKKKKMLLVLVPVLVIVLVLTVPRTLKQLRGSEAAPTDSTTPASTDAGDAGSTTPAESGAAPAAPPISTDPQAVAASAKELLEETDAPPDPDEGQLVSFTRFEARDPFAQLVDDQPEDTSTTDPSGAAPPTTPSPTATPAPTTPAPTTPPPTDPGNGGTTEPIQVKISVNGRVSVVDVGDTFPENDPAFEIISIGSDSIEIGLVSGSFSNGADTLTVKLGEPVTLISQPDGARYTIKLLGPA
jgi:hypothetical protein